MSDFIPAEPVLFARIEDAIAYSRLIAEVTDDRLAAVCEAWA